MLLFVKFRVQVDICSLVIKDLMSKAKDIKNFQDQGQDFFFKAKAKDRKLFRGLLEGQAEIRIATTFCEVVYMKSVCDFIQPHGCNINKIRLKLKK